MASLYEEETGKPFDIKKIKPIEDPAKWIEENIDPYIGDMSTERGRRITNLILQKAAFGGMLQTFFTALEDPERVIPKVDAKGIGILPADIITQDFYPSVNAFMDYCRKSGIHFELWNHPESTIKSDIGYRIDEIAITLAYALDDSMTSFFVFTRPSEDSGFRIPKRTIKKYSGAKDVVKAAQQAIVNLEGIMEKGHIGPFPQNKNDVIYIDRSSLERNRDLPVNYATGHKNYSFNIRLGDSVDALTALHGENVKVVDFYEQPQ